MTRRLNKAILEETSMSLGLTQTSVADQLGVTKAAVSKWVTGKSFPRPPELLKLGKLLGLAYSQLVEPTDLNSAKPIVAFRKRANTKTTPMHLARAREMGRLLKPVVKHLPFDEFLSPTRLKRPSLEYDYIQGLVAELRNELNIDSTAKIGFPDLIAKFQELQTVIIPVLWGQKNRHGNALHIYLPESETTWIYLNLDSYVHDFMFWMAHELGHVLAMNFLSSDVSDLAEGFSDAFAGALLFPEKSAKICYETYITKSTSEARIKVLIETGKKHLISPNTVYKELQKFAEARGMTHPTSVPDQKLFSIIAVFNRGSGTVSNILFGNKLPSADEFVRVSEKAFGTPIFEALSSYLKESPQSDSVISSIFDVALTDAKELREVLI